jgi:thiol:disulfide interchange protein DsbC
MRLIRHAVMLLAVVVCAASFAANDDVPADVAAKIKATLRERIPDLRVDQIHKSPMAGLYEVNTGQELVYTNDAATLIFVGRIVDTKTREDLTAQRWNDLNAIDFSSLPFDLALKTVKGDGSRKLAVFADPLCPYCRQLEQEMQGLNNVTVYTFLFPLESIHPGSTVKATQIWCSKDRNAAWSKWMLKNADPGNPHCDGAPVAKLQTLGEKLRIDSTPTLFASDGRRIRGAIRHDDLEHVLADSHK